MTPPPPPKPGNNLKKPLLIVGIIGGVCLLGTIGFIGLVCFWLFTAKDIPVTETDRQLTVTAHDLAPYYDDFQPSADCESFIKERFIDFSQELFYEYDSPALEEPYLSTTISYEHTMSDAIMVYGIQWSMSKAAFNIVDTDYEIVEDNAFYRVGDQSRFAHIKYNGEVQGHILVARKKYAIYTFILSGYILDQPELWHELFDERINQLPRHAPEFKFNFNS